MGTIAEMLSTPLGVVEWFVYLLAAVMFVIGLAPDELSENRPQG